MSSLKWIWKHHANSQGSVAVNEERDNFDFCQTGLLNMTRVTNSTVTPWKRQSCSFSVRVTPLHARLDALSEPKSYPWPKKTKKSYLFVYLHFISVATFTLQACMINTVNLHISFIFHFLTITITVTMVTSHKTGLQWIPTFPLLISNTFQLYVWFLVLDTTIWLFRYLCIVMSCCPLC